MYVPLWLWATTVAGLLVLIAVDLVIVDHRPHEITTGEAARWVVFYVLCAALFGAGVWLFAGHDYGVQFFTGYLTEYSLSVDNLFIFMVIMASFKVPVIHQHRVLLIGILIALTMRSVFIAIGAALISQFVWVFFAFGAVLTWTAINMLRGNDDEAEYQENALTRWVRKICPVTEEFHGHQAFIKIDGKRRMTPMALVVVAIGSADLLFAVDSIPAIFGITEEGFLVFTANAFALMGLRQLYFLIGGLLQRLVYLAYGLAFLLFFIGVKLVLHAMHENALPFINGGEPIDWAPDIPIWVSLLVIVGTLTVTTVLSLAADRRTARSSA